MEVVIVEKNGSNPTPIGGKWKNFLTASFPKGFMVKL
jgi:hypothetical protein